MTSANHDNTINSSGLTGFCLSDCLSVSASVWLAINNILLYTDLSIFLFIFRCNYSPIQCVTYLFTHFNAILDVFHGLSAGIPLKTHTSFSIGISLSASICTVCFCSSVSVDQSYVLSSFIWENERTKRITAKSIGLITSKVRSSEYVTINHSCFIFISCIVCVFVSL